MENDFALNNTKNTLRLNEKGTDPEGRFEQNERVEALTCHQFDSSCVYIFGLRITINTYSVLSANITYEWG